MEPTSQEPVAAEPQEPTEGQPAASDASPDETSVVDLQALEASILSKLAPQLGDLRTYIDQRTQSVKDKRIGRLEKQFDEVRNAAAIMKRFQSNLPPVEGVDLQQATDRTLLQMLLDGDNANAEPAPSTPEQTTSPQAGGADDSYQQWVYGRADRIVEKAGTTWSDPRLAAVVARQNWDSGDDYLDAVADALRQPTNNNAPTPAVQQAASGDVVEPVGTGSTTARVSDADLIAAIRKHQIEHPDNPGGRSKLIAEAKERGIWK
ncbi:MAG: hypothetical protein ACE5FI_17460 [Anaerolineales bacterium]